MLRTYASFRYKHARCSGEERIKWDFSNFLDEESQFAHAQQWIYDYLTNTTGVFKIGLTFQPLERCVHDDYGYFTLGYSRVTFVCCDENPHTICRLEERLIDQFRFWGPKGSVFDPKKCARCMNRAIGGLSGLHGSSPFFVYIATRSWISTYRPWMSCYWVFRVMLHIRIHWSFLFTSACNARTYELRLQIQTITILTLIDRPLRWSNEIRVQIRVRFRHS